MGDGRLGWLIAGLLIGVAGTLVTQELIQKAGQDAAAAPAAQVRIEPGPPPSQAPVQAAKPAEHHHVEAAEPPSSAGASGASASAWRSAGERASTEIDDDAAATGMTSRTRQDTDPTN